MSDLTTILQAIERGDADAGTRLLSLVYDELRRVAAQKLAQEKPGQTLEATALVHEVYLRFQGARGFENRRHFFGAAAEAMRRILVENARRKARIKHGGTQRRQELQSDIVAAPTENQNILALDAALAKLAAQHPIKARLVELRFFTGLTADEAAEILDISPSTADRHWAFARAWLRREIESGPADQEK